MQDTTRRETEKPGIVTPTPHPDAQDVSFHEAMERDPCATSKFLSSMMDASKRRTAERDAGK